MFKRIIKYETTPIPFKVEPKMKMEIEKLCKKHKVSRSEFIRKWIQVGLNTKNW